MNDGLKIQRCNFLPEGEMGIIKDTNTLIHNIVDNELKEKDKEIERLNNIINKFEKYLVDVKQFAYLDKLKELKESKGVDSEKTME